jgi:hypothetical protein
VNIFYDLASKKQDRVFLGMDTRYKGIDRNYRREDETEYVKYLIGGQSTFVNEVDNTERMWST